MNEQELNKALHELAQMSALKSAALGIWLGYQPTAKDIAVLDEYIQRAKAGQERVCNMPLAR